MELKSKFHFLFHKTENNPSNKSLHEVIRRQAILFGVRVYDSALNWLHIHLLIRVKNRRDYVKFIRSLTAIIALKAKAYSSKFERIFNLRPFTRILSWGKDFKNALDYHVLNQLESLGHVVRTKKKYKSPSRKHRV